MKILVTGARGMVGQNIIETFQSHGRHEVLTPGRDIVDFEDRDNVRAYLISHQPDAVIHAAGKVGGIRANMAQPVEFLAVNLRIGMNVIDESKAAGIPYLLNIASSCMYPRDGENPLKEEAILTGALEPTNEGYAIAKIATTRLCEYIRTEHPTLHYKTVIPCNLYGRYDHFDPHRGHMIAAVLQRMYEAHQRNEAELSIWGDGTARREFMYVGDLAEFVVQYIEKLEDLPDVMNIGLGFDYSINEYYRAIRSVIGFHGAFTHDLSKPVGMQQKLVDVRRQKELGWVPRVSLEDGLRQTFSYFLETLGAIK
ncbi:MAG: GDP-L-fucose synthase [Spirochaeta sp.]|jgi:GDP-L-fucose synthase|nr:GDP-L-fucose synthase [Spirochaeta sp.]